MEIKTISQVFLNSGQSSVSQSEMYASYQETSLKAGLCEDF